MIEKGALIVSCQADQGSPFDNPLFIRAFAQAAKLGGAGAFRLQGVENITAVRKDQKLPIIGLIKRRNETFGDVYITPEPSDVIDLIEAGTDIVAFDATLRKRPTAISELIDLIHQHGKLAMADISTAIEAIAALDAGADYVSTTLSGYTNYSPKLEGPDLELISSLAMHGIEAIAEGRIRTPAEAREALARGAFAVVVGSAITRPDVVTSWFTQEMSKCSTMANPLEYLNSGDSIESPEPLEPLEVLDNVETFGQIETPQPRQPVETT
jgi:N-acylglucosamine-6-phosphate 2-epimerase